MDSYDEGRIAQLPDRMRDGRPGLNGNAHSALKPMIGPPAGTIRQLGKISSGASSIDRTFKSRASGDAAANAGCLVPEPVRSGSGRSSGARTSGR
jgi:hypothetical protein